MKNKFFMYEVRTKSKFLSRFFELNLHWLFFPWVLYFFGAGLNDLCVTANGGFMPVWSGAMADTSGIADEIHQIMTHASHLKILSDWIYLPYVGIASIGDGFIWTGKKLEDIVPVGWLVWLFVRSK